MPRLAAGCLAALALAVVAAGPVRADMPDLETLLKQIALKGPQQVPFEERRYLGALDTPLLSRGHLRYEPPDRLIKQVESPRRETAVAGRDRLAVLDADGAETASIDLAESPDLALVFDALRGVLSGDAAALRAAFNLRLTGDARAWRLDLTPNAEPGATRIRQIAVTGDADRVESFEIRQRGGDRTLIRLIAEQTRP